MVRHWQALVIQLLGSLELKDELGFSDGHCLTVKKLENSALTFKPKIIGGGY